MLSFTKAKQLHEDYKVNIYVVTKPTGQIVDHIVSHCENTAKNQMARLYPRRYKHYSLTLKSPDYAPHKKRQKA